MTCVGILALQGDFAAHAKALDALGVAWQLVKMPADLDAVDGLIIPGGESTTLLKLMEPFAMRPALETFHAQGHPIFGTCAGLILLARETQQPVQDCLGFIDIVAGRNAYGRQVDSFIGQGEPLVPELGPGPLEMVFIRAPKILHYDSTVTPLATCRGDVVLARQNHVLVSAFHPELSTEHRVHSYFLQMVMATVGEPA